MCVQNFPEILIQQNTMIRLRYSLTGCCMTALLVVAIVPIYARTWNGAHERDGKKIILNGNSVENLGRASTGVSISGLSSFRENPAAIADNTSISFATFYGSSFNANQLFHPSLTFAVPTSFGVYGGSLQYINISNGSDFRNAYDAMVGAGKSLSRNLKIGLSARYFIGMGHSRKQYAGAAIGWIYRLPESSKKDGFGIVDASIGMTVNAGYPLNGNFNDLNTVSFGYSFKFFQIPVMSIGFVNDVNVINYKFFPVKWGIEMEFWDILVLRAGFCYPYSYKTDFSAGAGLKFNLYGFHGRFDYSFVHTRENSYIHYLGFSGEFGMNESVPPAVSIILNSKFISPNGDGNNDYILFGIEASSQRQLRNWRLMILNSSGTIVREYSSNKLSGDAALTAGKFFKNMFIAQEHMSVPEHILWDGTDNAGARVNDGKYSYAFYAGDTAGNISRLATGPIIVNSVKPEIALKLTLSRQSFMENKLKDTVFISHQLKALGSVSLSGGFKNQRDSIVRHYQWNSENEIPSTLKWDGTDDSGNMVEEGYYTYFISGADEAGNRLFKEIKDIPISRVIDIPDVSVNSACVSFVRTNTISFYPSFQKNQLPEQYKIELYDRKNKLVHEIIGSDATRKMYEWNGLIGRSRISEGVYLFRIRGKYLNGKTFSSFKKKLIIDNTGPLVSLSHSPVSFTPDNDGDNDYLYLKTRVRDVSGVREWKYSVYSSSGELFKVIEGKGDIPQRLAWNGRGDKQELPESLARYTIQLVVSDNAGNTTRSSRVSIQTGILLYSNPEGFTLRLNTVSFGLGTSTLKFKSKLVLDEVYSAILRFTNYSIIVEGHTDDIGKEDNNLALSEKMAEAVCDYLVKKGISRKRIRYVGMGESVPLYPNNGNENRRKNRRIDIKLIKMD